VQPQQPQQARDPQYQQPPYPHRSASEWGKYNGRGGGQLHYYTGTIKWPGVPPFGNKLSEIFKDYEYNSTSKNNGKSYKKDLFLILKEVMEIESNINKIIIDSYEYKLLINLCKQLLEIYGDPRMVKSDVKLENLNIYDDIEKFLQLLLSNNQDYNKVTTELIELLKSLHERKLIHYTPNGKEKTVYPLQRIFNLATTSRIPIPQGSALSAMPQSRDLSPALRANYDALSALPSTGSPLNARAAREGEMKDYLRVMGMHLPPRDASNIPNTGWPLQNALNNAYSHNRGGTASRKIKFIKNKKEYSRVVHTEKNKHYIIFEKKKVPLSKLKIIS